MSFLSMLPRPRLRMLQKKTFPAKPNRTSKVPKYLEPNVERCSKKVSITRDEQECLHNPNNAQFLFHKLPRGMCAVLSAHHVHCLLQSYCFVGPAQYHGLPRFTCARDRGHRPRNEGKEGNGQKQWQQSKEETYFTKYDIGI